MFIIWIELKSKYFLPNKKWILEKCTKNAQKQKKKTNKNKQKTKQKKKNETKHNDLTVLNGKLF